MEIPFCQRSFQDMESFVIESDWINVHNHEQYYVHIGDYQKTK